MQKGYDDGDAQSIASYADGLIGKTLRQVSDVTDDDLNTGKGDLGSLVERFFYGIQPPNDNEPDFPKANLELKTTGVKQNADGTLVPKERLVLGMINYYKIIDEDFGSSHFLNKNGLLLVLFYLFMREVAPIDRPFLAKRLWEIPEDDEKIIRKDWQTIVRKVRDGLAHELSEGDTLYLGACTKGADSSKLTAQPNSEIKAKPRAFALKASYVRTMLEDETTRRNLYDNFLSHTKSEPEDIEQAMLKRFDRYIGKSYDEIVEEIGEGVSETAKNRYAQLTNRMLGVKTKKVAELEKAGVNVRTIRLNTKGTPKEDVSFPAFKYTEIVNQQWDESDFKNIVESRFLFVLYQESGDGLIFKGAMFWSMPYKDRLEAERVWNETRKRIAHNRADDLPGKKFSHVAHVRPHGQTGKDKLPTPYGKPEVKKCFWINALYLSDQLSKQ